MIRYLCDTSCLVAAVSSWHEHHKRTCSELGKRRDRGEELVLAAHSLVETYAVLTRLPPKKRLRSADALAVIEANWHSTPNIHLARADTWHALRTVVQLEIVGGRTYDALIARAAIKAHASTILTWNVRDFAPFASEVSVETPD